MFGNLLQVCLLFVPALNDFNGLYQASLDVPATMVATQVGCCLGVTATLSCVGFLNACFPDWYKAGTDTRLPFRYNAQRTMYWFTHAKQPGYWESIQPVKVQERLYASPSPLLFYRLFTTVVVLNLGKSQWVRVWEIWNCFGGKSVWVSSVTVLM